jgi:hypothetical protein
MIATCLAKFVNSIAYCGEDCKACAGFYFPGNKDMRKKSIIPQKPVDFAK